MNDGKRRVAVGKRKTTTMWTTTYRRTATQKTYGTLAQSAMADGQTLSDDLRTLFEFLGLL
jgi:hypothetical protein